MNRRKVVVYGAAAATVALGLSVSVWRSRSKLSAAEATFWALRFDRPEGGELALSDFLGRPLLLNFWATWCPPCVTEMPLLDVFFRQQPSTGWRVLGLAVDNPTAVREFLARHPVGFAVGLAGLDGVELTRALGNGAGTLPFSVVFDSRGSAVHRKLGVIRDDDLAVWARTVT